MPKLLIISHAAVLTVNRDLFYELNRQFAVDLRIVCPTFWRGDLIRELRCQVSAAHPEVPVAALPVWKSGNGSLFLYRRSLRKAFPGWEPDLVFVDEEPWSLACWQAYRAFPRARKVFYTKQNLRKPVPFPFSLIQKNVFARSPSCFAVAGEVAEVLRWKGYAQPIEVLPHSFDPGRFSVLPDATRAEVRRGLGLDPAATVIGYFGRLEPEKGLDDFQRALEILAAKNIRNLEVLVVGNGSLAPQMRELAERQTGLKIIFREAISHDLVGKTLGAIDLLVLPSRTTRRWKEQFGRILVEAMACSVAVVGSDSGEIPHLIARSGAGVSVPERNPAALALALSDLVQDPAKLRNFKNQGETYARTTMSHAALAGTLGNMLGLSARST